jgi:hypothetical protein
MKSGNYALDNTKLMSSSLVRTLRSWPLMSPQVKLTATNKKVSCIYGDRPLQRLAWAKKAGTALGDQRQRARNGVRRAAPRGVSRHFVSLATYMGHTDIVHTYWSRRAVLRSLKPSGPDARRAAEQPQLLPASPTDPVAGRPRWCARRHGRATRPPCGNQVRRLPHAWRRGAAADG